MGKCFLIADVCVLQNKLTLEEGWILTSSSVWHTLT